MSAKNQYTCANCGQEFETQWPDEDAWAAAALQFGSQIFEEASVVVCDDCYRQITEDVLSRVSWTQREQTDETSAVYEMMFDSTLFLVEVEVTEGGFGGVFVEHPDLAIPTAANFERFKRNAAFAAARIAYV